MTHLTPRHDAPQIDMTKPARAARLADKLRRYRRARLSHGIGRGGIFVPPTLDPRRDRALRAVFGPHATA